jgi:MaoC dehydratase-like protein
MPLNTAFAGRRYPASEPYDITRDQVDAFIAALGGSPPPTDESLCPPTFPIVVSMHAERDLMHDPNFGLDYSRVVHREQKFIATRPIRVGDRLTATVTVLAVESLGGNDLVTTECDIRTLNGEHVCTTVSTMLARDVERAAA